MEEMRQKRIWDNYEVIGEVRKSDGIKYVIAAATREGFRFINIREFYLRKRDGEWKPGRDGISIPLTAALNKGETFIHPYKELKVMMQSAAEHAHVMPLMDPEKAVYADYKQKQIKE